jgi:hypothetical protein
VEPLKGSKYAQFRCGSGGVYVTCNACRVPEMLIASDVTVSRLFEPDGSSKPAKAMETKILIDSIMRQTTVLIAQLSATAGIRAPLAHLADEVFLTLSSELEDQGVSRKVVADMFGMALRSYQRRVQRLRESATDKGRTLWQSMLEYLQTQGRATRRSLLDAFPDDDPEAIAAVLNDLVQSGLASRTGSGAAALYTITADEDRRTLAREGGLETAATLAWLDLCRHPGAAAGDVAVRIGLEEELVRTAFTELRNQGRITAGPDGRLSAQPMIIPVGAEAGWEAAVFDHFQAVTAAITTKLRDGHTRSAAADTTGGATLTFDIYDGHPYADRVLGMLGRIRAEIGELWQQVEDHNAQHPVLEDDARRVTFYFGQFLKASEEEE